VCLNIRRLTLEVAEYARKADLRIIGWVVNTQDHLRLARALELDGVTTDYPEIRRIGRLTA
jgi:glycerophosphoryl diester phosphodiesterase